MAKIRPKECSQVSFTYHPTRPSNILENGKMRPDLLWIRTQEDPEIHLIVPTYTGIRDRITLQAEYITLHGLSWDSEAFCPGHYSFQEWEPFLLLSGTCLTLDLACTFLVSVFSSKKCRRWTNFLRGFFQPLAPSQPAFLFHSQESIQKKSSKGLKTYVCSLVITQGPIKKGLFGRLGGSVC